MPPFYGQYSLTPVRTAPLLVDNLFPDLNDIPQFPAPFSIDPNNRVGVHAPVERATSSTPSRGNYLFEVAYTGSQS